MAKSKHGKKKPKKHPSKQDRKENVSGCDDADLARKGSDAIEQGEIPEPNMPSNKESGGQTQAHIEIVLLNPGTENPEQRLKSPEERNDWVHSDPQPLLNHIAKIHARRLAKCDMSEIAGCNVACCSHFLSVRNSKADDPERYAKELLPLAKQFLAQEKDSQLPHLPFIKVTAEGKEIVASKIDDEVQERSVLHAQRILTKHGSLREVDLQTAEETARLTNQRKISWALIKLLTSPSKNRVRDYEATSYSELDHKAAASLELDRKATTASEPEHQPPTSLEPNHETATSSEIDRETTTSLEPDHEIHTSEKPGHSVERDPLSPLPELDISCTQVASCTEAHSEAMDQATDALDDPDVVKSSQSMPPPKQSKNKKRNPQKAKKTSNDIQPHAAILPALPQVSCPKAPLAVESTTGPAMSSSSYTETHKGKSVQTNDVVESEVSKNLSGTPIEMEDLTSFLTSQGISDPALAKLASDIKARREEIRRQIAALSLPEKSATAEATQSLPKSTTDSPRIPVGWAYATNTDADHAFEEAGIWLYEKPPTYFLPQELPCIMISDQYRPAPVQISQKHTGTSEPAIFFDGISVEIVPHTDPWPDMRSNFAHPDFLPPIRLAEVQACELAGYSVWRQDRQYMTCRKLGCDQILYDPDPSVIACQGCGPFVAIRYCSLEHQILDMDDHKNECGSSSVLMQTIVLKAATPLRFMQACPMISVGNASESYQFYLQKTMAVLLNGRYTIFKPFLPASTTLSWPTTHGHEVAQEMNRRIERLLNATFFGYRSHHTMKYLYCTLRALIGATASPKYPHEIMLLGLTVQFSIEFGHDFSYIDRQRNCECEWHGTSFQGTHVAECPWSDPEGALFGETVGEGVQTELASLEARYWILRAWQQQHPTVHDWKERAQGLGFAGPLSGTDEQRPGPGFEGWGAADSNIFD